MARSAMRARRLSDAGPKNRNANKDCSDDFDNDTQSRRAWLDSANLNPESRREVGQTGYRNSTGIGTGGVSGQTGYENCSYRRRRQTVTLKCRSFVV
jgi:hypothetical protein